MNRKLFVSEKLNIDPDKVNIIGSFCNFCADQLPIKNGFEIYVVDNRELNGISTTAAYHCGKNRIFIYGLNRAMVDILRSIAHEMVHMRQDEMGMINGPIQDIGGFHEDEANAVAGQMIKLYARDGEAGREIYESKTIISNRKITY